MSHPDPSQQPQWQHQPPGRPGQGFPPPQGPVPGQQYAAPGVPGGVPGAPGGGVPGGPPPGQYSGGYGPPPGGGGGRNRWLIPAAAGVALVVMGGTVWATVSLVSFGGPQPESVLPGSSVAFGKVDLSIDGSQAMELIRFVDQLPAEMTEEMDEPDGDMTELFAEVFVEAFPESRQADVEEWIGQRAGVSVWPTADAAAEVDEGSGLAMALALAVEDERRAEEELASLASGDDTLHFEMTNGFALLSTSEAALADRAAQVDEHGSLEDSDVYSGDVADVPGGSLAVGWTDFTRLMEVEGVAAEIQSGMAAETGEVSGRATASLRIDGDYLEARADVFDFEVDSADLAWLAETPGASVAAMESLPESTVMAFGASGLDTALTDAYESDEIPFLSGSGEMQEMEREFNAMGAPLPEGFTNLLGSSTAFGVTGMDLDSFFGSAYGGGEEFSFQYRAVGGDEGVLGDFVENVAASDPYATPPGVATDGDAVVVASGSSATGRLGDDPVFQQTMQEMDDAVVAGYFDMRQVLTDTEVQNPAEWGAMGLAVSVTEEGRRSGVELRWSPSGGGE
ncbi:MULTISPECIES: hypothetical protein [Nocardiopsidaceae]|uniref:DUF3352 domain-containing protein n=1 Tax=Streptomonospora nanhaiensis TaxID=1323731 RepID=A0ABY6YK91_9ACTN|nr:hypothetical protein [Streptomonospora nanhaiensis]WAE72742.1 hypothetical protein OUQ99_26745 [Streptomonospora nanhaiensis]